MRHFLLKLRYDFLWALSTFLWDRRIPNMPRFRSWVYLKARRAMIDLEHDYAQLAESLYSKSINPINGLPSGGDRRTWADQEMKSAFQLWLEDRVLYMWIRALPFLVAVWIEDRALDLDLATGKILMRLGRIDINNVISRNRSHRIAYFLHAPFIRLASSTARLCYSKALNTSRQWANHYEDYRYFSGLTDDDVINGDADPHDWVSTY